MSLHDSDSNKEKPTRRIIDLIFFLQQLRRLDNHSTHGCKFSDMILDSEQKYGVVSSLKFVCTVCDIRKTVWTHQSDKISPNTDIVRGIMEISKDLQSLTTILSNACLPLISSAIFLREVRKVNKSNKEVKLKENWQLTGEKRIHMGPENSVEMEEQIAAKNFGKESIRNVADVSVEDPMKIIKPCYVKLERISITQGCINDSGLSKKTTELEQISEKTKVIKSESLLSKSENCYLPQNLDLCDSKCTVPLDDPDRIGLKLSESCQQNSSFTNINEKGCINDSGLSKTTTELEQKTEKAKDTKSESLLSKSENCYLQQDLDLCDSKCAMPLDDPDRIGLNLSESCQQNSCFSNMNEKVCSFDTEISSNKSTVAETSIVNHKSEAQYKRKKHMKFVSSYRKILPKSKNVCKSMRHPFVIPILNDLTQIGLNFSESSQQKFHSTDPIKNVHSFEIQTQINSSTNDKLTSVQTSHSINENLKFNSSEEQTKKHSKQELQSTQSKSNSIENLIIRAFKNLTESNSATNSENLVTIIPIQEENSLEVEDNLSSKQRHMILNSESNTANKIYSNKENVDKIAVPSILKREDVWTEETPIKLEMDFEVEENLEQNILFSPSDKCSNTEIPHCSNLVENKSLVSNCNTNQNIPIDKCVLNQSMEHLIPNNGELPSEKREWDMCPKIQLVRPNVPIVAPPFFNENYFPEDQDLPLWTITKAAKVLSSDNEKNVQKEKKGILKLLDSDQTQKESNTNSKKRKTEFEVEDTSKSQQIKSSVSVCNTNQITPLDKDVLNQFNKNMLSTNRKLPSNKEELARHPKEQPLIKDILTSLSETHSSEEQDLPVSTMKQASTILSSFLSSKNEKTGKGKMTKSSNKILDPNQTQNKTNTNFIVTELLYSNQTQNIKANQNTELNCVTKVSLSDSNKTNKQNLLSAKNKGPPNSATAMLNSANILSSLANNNYESQVLNLISPSVGNTNFMPYSPSVPVVCIQNGVSQPIIFQNTNSIPFMNSNVMIPNATYYQEAQPSNVILSVPIVSFVNHY